MQSPNAEPYIQSFSGSYTPGHYFHDQSRARYQIAWDSLYPKNLLKLFKLRNLKSPYPFSSIPTETPLKALARFSLCCFCLLTNPSTS